MGIIQDWQPVHYSEDEVPVPYFSQDTPAVRKDIAAQYTTMSRLDQGNEFRRNQLFKISAGCLVLFRYVSFMKQLHVSTSMCTFSCIYDGHHQNIIKEMFIDVEKRQ